MILRKNELSYRTFTHCTGIPLLQTLNMRDSIKPCEFAELARVLVSLPEKMKEVVKPKRLGASVPGAGNLPLGYNSPLKGSAPICYGARRRSSQAVSLGPTTLLFILCPYPKASFEVTVLLARATPFLTLIIIVFTCRFFFLIPPPDLSRPYPD